MANLILTNQCNIRCPFCFASETRPGGDVRAAAMDMGEFHRLVNHLSIQNSVRFCGGEPTLHPQFLDMVEATLARPEATVFVMTNGLWSKQVQAYFRTLPTQKVSRVTCLVNVLEPGFYRDGQIETLHATLESVWSRTTMLGFTIHKAPFDYSPMLDLARRHGITSIRYAIAAPNVTDPRSWLIDPETDFRPLAATLVSLFRDSVVAGFKLVADCGYLPPCAFTEEQLSEIARMFPDNSPLVFRCGTALDVDYEGKAWRCYGLQDVLQANVYDYGSATEVIAGFDRRVKELSGLHLFDKCRTCDYLARGVCQGGCYAMRVSRAKKRDASLNLFPTTRDADLLDCRPVLTREVAFRRSAAGHRDVVLMERRGTIERISADDPEENESLLKFLDAADGRKSLRDLLAVFAHAYDDPVECQTDVLRLARTLFEWDVITFDRDAQPVFAGEWMRESPSYEGRGDAAAGLIVEGETDLVPVRLERISEIGAVFLAPKPVVGSAVRLRVEDLELQTSIVLQEPIARAGSGADPDVKVGPGSVGHRVTVSFAVVPDRTRLASLIRGFSKGASQLPPKASR